MEIDIRVKSKFIVNGKEYGSVEEMPDEVREAYGKATAGFPGTGPAGAPEAEDNGLVFNGKEYASEDDMPREERDLYKVVMQVMEKEGASTPGGMDRKAGVFRPEMRVPDASGKPIAPGSSLSPRKLVSFTAVLALLLGVAYLLFAAGG